MYILLLLHIISKKPRRWICKQCPLHLPSEFVVKLFTKICVQLPYRWVQCIPLLPNFSVEIPSNNYLSQGSRHGFLMKIVILGMMQNIYYFKLAFQRDVLFKSLISELRELSGWDLHVSFSANFIFYFHWWKIRWNYGCAGILILIPFKINNTLALLPQWEEYNWNTVFISWRQKK